jgi:hypothetical protein
VREEVGKGGEPGRFTPKGSVSRSVVIVVQGSGVGNNSSKKLLSEAQGKNK